MRHSGTIERWRIKPVEVNALQWTGDNIEAVCEFIVRHGGDYRIPSGPTITNLYFTPSRLWPKGETVVGLGSWFVQYSHGLRNHSDEAFRQGFVRVEPESACETCHGEGRIDLMGDWHGPPGVERHHWHPCPDCDTPARFR